MTTTSCIFLSGCSFYDKHQINPPPTYPWKGVENIGLCTPNCTDADAYTSVLAATQYCRGVSNYYDNKSTNAKTANRTIKFVGILAGSIFGVTAGGSAAKAWSALSGATNGLQSDLEDTSLSRSNRAKIISGLLEKYHDTIQISITQKNPPDTIRNSIVFSSFAVSAQCATLSQVIPTDESKNLEKIVLKLEDLSKKIPEQASPQPDGLANH